MIYLASPYTDKDYTVMEDRYVIVRDITAALLAHGEIIFSPIVHCHELAKHNDMPRDIDFWWNYNRAMLHKADHLWILTLEGWRNSSGIKRELKFALDSQIDFELLLPDSLDLIYLAPNDPLREM